MSLNGRSLKRIQKQDGVCHLWSVYGIRYNKYLHLWDQITQDGETKLDKGHAERLLEEEAVSIERRCHPRPMQHQSSYLSDLISNVSRDIGDRCDQGRVQSYHDTLQAINERCRDFHDLRFNARALQEEQECELSPEVEQERQTQKAPPATPLTHHLHLEIVQFALPGAFNPLSTTYMPAFASLKDLACTKDYEASQLVSEGRLLVSADFATTVKHHGTGSKSDSFQRQVNWALGRRTQNKQSIDYIMIVSPYKANLLFSRMHGSPNLLMLYKPRTNSGYFALDGMNSISGTAVLPVAPRALVIQLNLFAGQLYISSYADYLEICHFLGISVQRLTKNLEENGWQIDGSGIILRDGNGKAGGASGLTTSPVNFFRVFMSKIRRNGDGIKKTDIGNLLDGTPFKESD